MAQRSARHRAACRPTTPLTVAAGALTAPEARRKALALASSGLAIGVIAAQGATDPAFADSSRAKQTGTKQTVAINKAVTAAEGEFTITQATMKKVEKPVVTEEVVTYSDGRTVSVNRGSGAASTSYSQPASFSSATLPAANGSVAAIAQQYLGVPYVYGGSTPAGFDCSGFVKYVYAQAGKAVNGRTDRSIMAGGTKIPLSQAQPGDILWHAGHVGIYLGNGMYIHAPKPGDHVKIAPMAYGGFTTAVRY